AANPDRCWPMLEGHDIASLRLELAADLANVLLGLIIAWMVSTMQRVENAKLRLPRSIQDLQHMKNTVIRFCDAPNSVPYLATFRNEIVIGIDHKKCSDLLFICQVCHALSNDSRYYGAYWVK